MAKLKAEIEHEYHQRHGAGLRERLFANVGTLSKWGSALAPFSNWVSEVPGARALLEKTLGIARERNLPTFHRETLVDWFEERGGPRIPESEAARKVALFPDTYTNYNHPDAGKAAVRVLESARVHVRIPADVTDSGRPAHSKGFLDASRERARTNVEALAPRVRDGWDVVVVEPSDAVMIQSDYLDLLGAGESPEASRSGGQYAEPRTADPEAGLVEDGGGSDDATADGDLTTATERVAANTYGVCEYLDSFDFDLEFGDPDASLTYHGHCHQKATKKETHAVSVLREAGYEVDALDSGCCGMAGSFGYEAEHYSMSRKIGEILFDQLARSDGEQIVAPGASCRAQLDDWERLCGDPPHPIEKVAEALN